MLLIGGAAASPAVRAVAATVFSAPVHVPPSGEYVALGAARQAAWALAATPEPPAWQRPGTLVLQPALRPEVRSAYGAARQALYGGPAA